MFGTAEKFRAKGNHIITTKVEHHAMLHSCAYLEKEGYDVTYLDIDKDGRVDLKQLEDAITDKTILISIMLVNNEIGTIEPVKEAAAIAKKHKILFHTDAVQALGNVPIDVKDMGIDMMSMSSHKIYGPKGIGALFIRKGVRIDNYMHGGAQENNRRAGTENLAGIVGFGKAAQLAKENFDAHVKHSSQMRDYLGTIEPVKEAAAIAKKHKILFHTDAVQALGNVPIDVKDMGIDMMSMSSHKIYGPKGIGALFIRKGVRIDNYMHGGAQENNRRAGTENLAGIVGFGKAAQLAKENFDAHVKHSSQMRDYLKDRILSEIPDTFVNGTMDGRHPGNLNVTFEYIEGESILLLLNQFGISVSTGSACSSKSLEPSHVLAALGVPDEMIHGTVRFTVGDMTTKEDIDYVVDNLKTVVARLREISSVNAKKGW